MKEWRECFNKTFFSFSFLTNFEMMMSEENQTFAEITGLRTMPGLGQQPTLRNA